MGAVHWLRFRQEKKELNYWLSFAFVSDDCSWENILYLIYLVIFFSVWWFVVLVFFAGGGAAILQELNPQQPQIAAVAVTLIAFLLWFVVAGFRSLGRSPVVFSEEDAYLVCQMPLDPRKLGLRWMLMPWLKSLVPFAAFAVTLSFSLAEVGMSPGAITINRVLNYSWQGLRALLAIIPIHLAMFTMIWIIGVWRMNARRYNRLLPGPTALFGMSGLFLLLELLNMMGFALAAPSGGWGGGVGFILWAGFGQAPLIKALLMGWWLAAMFIMVFWLVSGQFSASWAAQETKETDQMKSLSRYGFAHQVREMRVKNRLRLRDQAIWAPAWEGPAAMVWKDLLQYWRSFSWDDFFDLLVLISSMMGLILLPTLSSRFFVVVFWAMRTGKITTARLQNDLSRWMIVKQLPLNRNQWIPADLTATSILVGLASLIGMILGSLQVRRFPPVEAVLLPGMIASVGGMAGFDLTRKARADLLLRGVSPQVGELAIIGSALCAGIPVSLTALVAGWPGVLIGFSASILIAGLMLNLAVNALRYNAQV